MKLERLAFIALCRRRGAGHRGDLLVAVCLWRRRPDGRRQGPATANSFHCLDVIRRQLRSAVSRTCGKRHDGLFADGVLGRRRRCCRQVSRSICSRASAGEAWGARLQRLLIPVDRVSTFVGHIFAWCILLLTFAVSYEVFSRYVWGARPPGPSMPAIFSTAPCSSWLAPMRFAATPMCAATSSTAPGAARPRRGWIWCCISCSFFPASSPSSIRAMVSPPSRG